MKFSKLSKLSLVSSLLALSFTVISCSSTKKADTKPAEQDQKAAQAQPVATQNPGASLTLKTVYFDFNKYVIRSLGYSF